MGLSKNGPITPWENSWAYQRAEQAGMTAAFTGKPYSENPYQRFNPQHLVWSQAHNGARAHQILEKEKRHVW